MGMFNWTGVDGVDPRPYATAIRYLLLNVLFIIFSHLFMFELHTLFSSKSIKILDISVQEKDGVILVMEKVKLRYIVNMMVHGAMMPTSKLA